MSRAGRARAAGAAALVLALGACSTPSVPAVPAAPRTPAPVDASWSGCTGTGAFDDPSSSGDAPPPTGGVPDGFVPTTVVLCEQQTRTNARGDTVDVDVERTSSEVAPLLAYLAQPDERPTDGACTADAWIPPWLALVDARGRFVFPAIPVDECSKPLGWYADRDRLAWLTLPYTDRVVREGDVVESAEAKESGCSMAYKDVVDAYATSSQRRDGRFPADPFDGQALSVCVFEVPAAERGTDAPAGELVSGRRLTDAERGPVVDALLAARETSAGCTTANARFAALVPAEGGPSLFVELDGCRRAVSDGDGTPVVRAGDDLVALLGG